MRPASAPLSSTLGAMPTACKALRTAPASIASFITPWPITSSLDQAALLPSTITWFSIISIPAEVLATPENIDRSRQTAASPTTRPPSSPSAWATPSAEAPRE